jgi:hypothetical protein
MLARSYEEFAVKAVALVLSLIISFFTFAAGAGTIPGKANAGSQPTKQASSAKPAGGLNVPKPAAASPAKAKSAETEAPAAQDTADFSGDELQQDYISEDVIPLSVQADPNSTVLPGSVLSARFKSDGGIDPVRISATLDGKPVTPRELKWRPTEKENNTDGWVMFTPEDPLPMGPVTVVFTAASASAEQIEPVEATYMVVGKQKIDRDEDGTTELKEVPGIEPLPEAIALPESMAYRIMPAEVYEEPRVVQIELPEGGNAEGYEIYFYSESGEHCGWYPSGNVSGWMVPDSRKVVEESGKQLIEIQINHSGIVELGKSTDVPAATTPSETKSGDKVNIKRLLDALLQTVNQLLSHANANAGAK